MRSNKIANERKNLHLIIIDNKFIIGDHNIIKEEELVANCGISIMHRLILLLLLLLQKYVILYGK